jgi:hypothetical protein
MTAGYAMKHSRAVHQTVPFVLLISIFMVYYIVVLTSFKKRTIVELRRMR